MPDSSVPRVTAIHALGIYAESLASGRRVVVVGDATDGLGATIAELGARVVHVYDPDAARAALAAASPARGVSIRALPPGDFDVRDGAFDVAIIPDLASVADPAALLARVRRLVGADGVAIVAARNPEAPDARARDDAADARTLDYYELYDLVSLQFASIRMIGQVPFHGVAIAELGEADGAPQVSVDTQLVPDAGVPDLFIALAGQHEARLDPYAIVQLPSEAFGAEPIAMTGAASGEGRVGSGATNAALAEAQLRAELLEAQLEEQRATSKAISEKLRDVDARAGDDHVRAERLVHDVRGLEEELKQQRDRAFKLTRELEDDRKARTKAELELAMIRKSPELATSRERVSELEESLHAAEVVVSALQARVGELEAIAGAASKVADELPAIVAELEVTRAVAIAGEESRVRLEQIAQRAEQLERRAAALEAELSRHGDGDAGADELAQLEAALRERAGAIQELEREVARRERIVQELVVAIDEMQHERGSFPSFHEPAQVPAEKVADEARVAAERMSAELRRKLDGLATELARREGDTQASAWRIAELEQELAAARSGPVPGITPPTVPPPAGAPAAGDLERQLAAARDEIDVLKQALAQEHEARKRIEAAARGGGADVEGTLGPA
jgi:SAM-dependent methyltransferase